MNRFIQDSEVISTQLAMERLRSVETVGSLGDTVAPHLPNAQTITSQWTMPTEASLCSYRSLHILGSTEH